MTLSHLPITLRKSKLKSIFERQLWVICLCSVILSWGFRRYEQHRKDRGAVPCCKMNLEDKKAGNGTIHLFKSISFDRKEAVERRSNKV